MGKKIVINGADFSENGIAPEFVRLNWIMSRNSSQVLDTKLVKTNRMKIEVDFSVPQPLLDEVPTEKTMHFICGSAGNSDNAICLFYMKNTTQTVNDNVMGVIGNISSCRATLKKIEDTDIHTASIDKENIVLDGLATPISIFGTYEEQTAIATKHISCLGRSSYAHEGADVHVHGFRVYSDYANENSLILDLVPVKISEDNRVCMYDKIGGEYFYTSDGENPLFG